MTTVQESPNGHRVLPPPCSIENPAEINRADLPTNEANPIPNPSYVHIDTNQLPGRCQFTFSDGRQCTMARSDIHPSLCRFHAEREEQLFGDPVPGGNVVGAAFDLPELYSACHDLTTAAGVNRALAQVFRLLAQRRISRQEAATFGHLAHLLLRTISAMRVLAGESHGHQEVSPVNKVAGPADQQGQQVEQPRNGIVEGQKGLSSRESHGDQELSRATKSTPFLPQKEVALSPDNKVAAPGDRSWAGSECDHDPVANKLDDPTGIVIATPPSADERGARFASRTVLRETSPASSPVKSVHSYAPPTVAPAASLSSQASQNEDLRNSRVQLTQNEHLRKVVT